MNVDIYRKNLLDKFNVIHDMINDSDEEIYFRTREECQRAIDEYIIPTHVMNRLVDGD